MSMKYQTTEDTPDRPGMPAPNTIIEELVLTPQRGPAIASAEPGRVPTTYRVLRTNQVDEYETQPASDAELRAAPQVMRARGDNFTGTARKAAKISIAPGDVEDFDDIRDLIKSLPDHEAMTEHEPGITSDRQSDRVTEENRNLRTLGWIYAASRENDNDFHLIVGRAPSKRISMYMTMEISGLPRASASSFRKLKKVRDTYQEFFTDLPGTGYDFYDPPVPVQIGGSLFFDISHSGNSRPGPADLRPDMPVVWEVHPVTHLVFEP